MPKPNRKAALISPGQAKLALGCDPRTLPLRSCKVFGGREMYSRKAVLLMAQRLKAGKPPTRDD